jgi:hypothetical protein
MLIFSFLIFLNFLSRRKLEKQESYFTAKMVDEYMRKHGNCGKNLGAKGKKLSKIYHFFPFSKVLPRHGHSIKKVKLVRISSQKRSKVLTPFLPRRLLLQCHHLWKIISVQQFSNADRDYRYSFNALTLS